MRTHLLIANRTLGGPELRRIIQDRLAAGSARFHVVVPATRRSGFMERAIDAYAGEPDQRGVSDDRAAASARLADELDRLRSLGAEADGEIGDADPVRAATVAAGHGDYDEVILSTLPPGASHWLGMDLPHRLERVLGRNITHVEGPAWE
jgi:GABA permease